MSQRVAHYGIIAVILLVMAACSKIIPGMKPPEPKPEAVLLTKTRLPPVNLTLQASATVNPSESARPSPIVVRVYQLKNDAAFRSAPYDRLYEDDQAALKTDLVEKTAFTLRPGDKTSLLVNFGDEVHFIGIAAFYREYDNTQWKIVVPLPMKGDGTILVDRSSVSFTGK